MGVEVITLPSRPISKGTTSVRMSNIDTVSGRQRALREVPLFVPRDQAYYWSLEWQRAEAEALREIAGGHGRRFDSGAAAAEWLLSDDEDE